MNIRMDRIAGECRQLHSRPLQTKAHSGNQISLLLEGHIVTTKLQNQLRFAFTAPLLQTYIQRKENWDDHLFAMIDWPAHGKYLASLPFPKRVNVIKMLHNWQYTKSRAMLFQDSDLNTCPLGCGHEETALHHLSCPKIPGSDLRSINRWMSHNNTAPPVQLAIITSLQAWIASEPTPLFSANDQDSIERQTSLAHSEQSILGWDQAFKGRLSKKWTHAQGMWYDNMRHNLHSTEKFPKSYTGPIWMKKLVAQLIFYNLNRWQIRNEAAHASDTAAEYEHTRDRYKETITALYQKNADSEGTTSIYRQPLSDVLTMSNERLSNWLHSHKASTSYRASKAYHQDTPTHTHETDR